MLDGVNKRAASQEGVLAVARVQAAPVAWIGDCVMVVVVVMVVVEQWGGL
jgi:hypothetical protein